MNKILSILCIALLSISCNDDDIAPAATTKDVLVTRISTNDNTTLELFYDVDKKLYRLNIYLLGNFHSYNVYEYNKDGLKELITYNANTHQMGVRTVFTLDEVGRVIKAEEYTPPDFFDDASSVFEFEYNASGRLAVRESSIGGQLGAAREEFVYDDKGNLFTIQLVLHPDQENEFLYSRIEYTPGDQPIPERWEEYVSILELSDHAKEIRGMFSTYIHYKYWTATNVVQADFSAETSDQVFDEDGNLTHQVVTVKDLLEPESPDVVTDMVYDYQKDN
jgi:hypothetical protein